MKVILIGASGTIGKRIADSIKHKHELVQVSRTSGDIQADITSSDSIENLYRQVGKFDALINVAGNGKRASLQDLTKETIDTTLQSKLVSQINLVLIGQRYINPSGSFTLSSGFLGEYPVPLSISWGIINAGIEAFVKNAAIELQNGVRINAVSPGLVKETAELMASSDESIVKDFYNNLRNQNRVSLEELLPVYIESLEGNRTGFVFKVH